MPRQSLADYLGQLSSHGNSCAFAQRSGYRTVRWSYREVLGVAAQCARELEARGIEPGDRVLLWGRNSAEWVAAIFGCILRGAIAVPMDQGATPDFAGRVAQQVDAKLLIVSREHVQASEQRPTIILDSLREAVARHSHEPYASPPLDRKSIVQIIFTSGATAEPKGVVISHGNILANLEPLESAMQPYLKWERFVHPIRFLDLVPLSHVFGQFMGVWVPPLLGATVFFQDTLNPAEIISTIKHERISVLIAVPRVLEALQGKIERDFEPEGALEAFRADFAAAVNEKVLRRMWRFRKIHRRFGWKFWAVISGGATLDPDVESFWGRIGFAVIQGYGMTETTSLVSVNHPFRIGRGSIGKVLKGREVKLDANGEILVRGENIAAGYWHGREIQPGAPAPVLHSAIEGDGRRRKCRMVPHGRRGRARCRRKFVFQGPQEKRYRHARGNERLSRRFGNTLTARTGNKRLRGRGARSRRKCGTLRRPAAARREKSETAASRSGNCSSCERITGGISANA